MGARRGLAYEVLENERMLITFVRDGGMVSRADWDTFLALLAKFTTNALATKHLVYVEEAAPPAAILRRISDIVRGRAASVALISPSNALRFVVSTFALVNRSIRFFTPEQLNEALAHMDCNLADQHVARAALARLRATD